MNKIFKELISSADEKYKDFHSSLIPNIDKNTLLGVRGPICKQVAKRYASTLEGEEFMRNLPHKYYDENLVHGYMLGFYRGTDIEEKIKAFLPYMDNWAVVDSSVSNLKCFFKNPKSARELVSSALSSSDEYIIRFGIVSLLCYYLTDEYAKDAIEQVKGIKSDKFYVKMAQAWFFATALTKQYDKAISIIEGRELDKWVHNKSIQKARESYRVSSDIKEYLKSLRIK